MNELQELRRRAINGLHALVELISYLQETPQATTPTPSIMLQGGPSPTEPDNDPELAKMPDVPNPWAKDPEPKAPKPKPVSTELRPVDIMQAWNRLGDPFARVRALNQKRAAIINQRLKEPSWLGDWRDALARVPDIQFCRGQNDRKWLANFNWFIRPDTVLRIMEGYYDNLHLSLKSPNTANAIPEVEAAVGAEATVPAYNEDAPW